MRIISKDNLPYEFQNYPLIKKSECDRHKRINTILERTLTRCNEMYAEYQSQTVELRESSQKEGFSLGFELFFSQVLQFIEQYTALQDARISKLKENITKSIKSSFDDSVIVERILHHLQEQCGQVKPLQIIIPHTACLDAQIDTSNFTFSNEEHITVQTEVDSIRFPISTLCQDWMDQSLQSVNIQEEYLQELYPHLLTSMQNKISALFDNLNK